MRTTQPIFLVAVFTMLIAFSPLLIQAQAVPDVVKAKFAEAYPDVKKAEWEVHDKGFEVEFEEDGYEMELLYAPDARILLAEEGIHPDDLPDEANDYLNETYPNIEVEEAARVTVGYETYYEAEFMLNGKEHEVYFNERGSHVSQPDFDAGDDDDVDDADED